MGFLTLLHTRLSLAAGQLFFAQGDLWDNLSVNTLGVRVTAVSVLTLTLLKIIGFFKRTPNIDVHFATKSEVAAAVKSLTESGDVRRHEIEGKIEALRKQVEKKMDSLQLKLDSSSEKEGMQMQAIQRQLGEISGRLQSLHPH